MGENTMQKPDIRFVVEVTQGDQPDKPDFNHGMENGMNNTQWQTTLAPVVSFFAGLLAAKIPWLDAGTWTQILGGVVGLAATLWGGLAARQNSLVSTVAAMDDVKSVTLSPTAPQSMITATPANVTK